MSYFIVYIFIWNYCEEVTACNVGGYTSGPLGVSNPVGRKKEIN